MIFTAAPAPSAVAATTKKTTKKTAKKTTKKAPARATTTTTRRTVTTAAPAPAPAATTVPAPTTVAATTTTVAPPAFAFAPALLSASVPAGTSITIPVWITNEPGFRGDISLSVSELPTGVTVTFDPVTARNYSVATVSVASSVTGGALPLALITGRAGTQVRTARLAVFVPVGVVATADTVPQPGATPFVLAVAQPTTPLVRDGATGAFRIAVSRSTGFTGPVTLSVPGPLPAGVFTSFSANPVSADDSTLFVTVTNRAAVGAVPIEILATGAGASLRITVVVTVA